MAAVHNDSLYRVRVARDQGKRWVINDPDVGLRVKSIPTITIDVLTPKSLVFFYYFISYK